MEEGYRNFFTVFPDIKLKTEVAEELLTVNVEKIATNHNKSVLKVYILSTHLISKSDLNYVEEQMEKQLFGRNGVRVIISERYVLSKQYNPENLWADYKQNIYDELKSMNIVMYNMLRKADVEFKEANIMKLTLEESVIGRTKEYELRRYIETVIAQRCGLPVDIVIEHKEAKD